MKFSLSIFAICLQVALASPTFGPKGLWKRASINDVATVGFATQNGGTTGGLGGTVTTVTTLDELTAAVDGNDPKIVIISGTIDATGEDEGVEVRVGANTSVLGEEGATLINIGIRALNTQNVIIRGFTIQKVLAPTDNIGIQASTNVWVDHMELSSDMDHDKDFYDGLLDITHAADWVTATNNFFHDHWKASLVGHSDSNGDEDTGHLTVTYADNMWQNINSRTPSLRFGTGHVFNSYFDSVNSGINTRDGAEVLIENNVWVDSSDVIFSTDDGFAVATGNDLGGGTNEAPEGTISPGDLPYSYTLAATDTVVASVEANAGTTVSFSA